MKTEQWIEGRWSSGRGAAEEVVAPATGEVIARVPEAEAAQVEEAVAAASRALPAWRRATPAERARALFQVAERIESAFEHLARIESENGGKPLHRVLTDERTAIVDPFRYFAGIARAQPGVVAGEYAADSTSFMRRDPLGVVALVTPWNYPLMMAAWKLAPALAAGNTVVLKPSEQTPLSTLALMEVLSGILPAGVVNVVTGRGETVGRALSGHPKVRLISLTGDISTGKEVMRQAASNLKRVHLELGGKAPVLIFADADVDRAVATVRLAGTYNAGQDCTAACRVFVARSIYDEVVSKLGGALGSLRRGPLDDPATELGPLIGDAHRQRVDGFVTRAAALDHTEVMVGGRSIDGRGFYYEPTLVAGARAGDEIVEREVFGPVVSATPFDDPEEVVGWVNDCEYGLAASVWTRDVARALRVSRDLEYGCVWVNQHLVWPTEMPHGGLKQSGMGKEMSPLGLEDYSVARHVMLSFEESTRR